MSGSTSLVRSVIPVRSSRRRTVGPRTSTLTPLAHPWPRFLALVPASDIGDATPAMDKRAATMDTGQRTGRRRRRRRLSASAAAAALGVSERTIRRAIARGDLPAAKRAGVYRIAPADLARYRRGAGLADAARGAGRAATRRGCSRSPRGTARIASRSPDRSRR